MTTDTPALQALRAAGLEHEVLSHGPVRSLLEVRAYKQSVKAAAKAAASTPAEPTRPAKTRSGKG